MRLKINTVADTTAFQIYFAPIYFYSNIYTEGTSDYFFLHFNCYKAWEQNKTKGIITKTFNSFRVNVTQGCNNKQQD